MAQAVGGFIEATGELMDFPQPINIEEASRKHGIHFIFFATRLSRSLT
jgi:hypothetical protein